MTMRTVPRTIFDRSLKLVRAPFDAALGAVGAADSSAKHMLDRIEAGARSRVGALFADDELRKQGREALLATRERERAGELRADAAQRESEARRNLETAGEEAARAKAEARREAEEKRRKADRRRRERESQAARSATTSKGKTAKTVAKVKRDNAKRDKGAQLEKLDAKEKSIEAKEAALRSEREAEQLKRVASTAKEIRKEPPGKEPGDISKDRSPYSALSNPARDPDPTEWPDPYDKREDPRDPPDPDGKPLGEQPHPQTGSTSTSEPHPSKDLEAGDRQEVAKRDKLDE